MLIVLSMAQAGLQAQAAVTGSIDLWGLVAPILGTGVGGALFIMVLFRVRIMPTYVHEDAKAAWEKEQARRDADHVAEIARLVADKDELKESLKSAQSIYVSEVIPTLTRVLDAERELVELRRDEAAERRQRRGS